MQHRTFITQVNPKLNLLELTGEHITIFPQRLQINDNDSAAEGIEIARVMLKDFDPDVDELLLSGDPVAMAICVGILAARFREMTLLKWDRRSGTYYDISITI